MLRADQVTPLAMLYIEKEFFSFPYAFVCAISSYTIDTNAPLWLWMHRLASASAQMRWSSEHKNGNQTTRGEPRNLEMPFVCPFYYLFCLFSIQIKSSGGRGLPASQLQSWREGKHKPVLGDRRSLCSSLECPISDINGMILATWVNIRFQALGGRTARTSHSHSSAY